jgi:hypothetical protein
MNKTAATVAVVVVIACAGYAFLRGDAVKNALPIAEAETIAAPAVDLTPENSLTTISGEKIALESLAHYDADADSTVYFLSEISPDSLVKIYEALEWKPEGKLGVKISTGESMKTNHLRPELIGKLVKQLDGTIVECNTAYGGNRMETAKHWQTIKEHGYLDMAPCDILDEEGSMTLKVDGYARIPENYVGTHFKNTIPTSFCPISKDIRWAGSAARSKTSRSGSVRRWARTISTPAARASRRGWAAFKTNSPKAWRTPRSRFIPR